MDAGEANPYSVSAELCAFAGWDTAEWSRHPQMLLNTADWVAEECSRFGIPIRALTAAEAQGGAAGVCQHVDLGAAGGGHWDCGPNFDMAGIINAATGGGGAHSPKPKRKGQNMIASTDDGAGYWIVKPDGAVTRSVMRSSTVALTTWTARARVAPWSPRATRLSG